MKIAIELVRCSSWNEALALQSMLEADGFAAVASTGTYRGSELHSVAVFGPIGYGVALRPVAALFAMWPEAEMLDALRAAAQDIPAIALIEDVHRETARSSMARAQRAAYETGGGRLRKQVGAPEHKHEHDAWDTWKPAR